MSEREGLGSLTRPYQTLRPWRKKEGAPSFKGGATPIIPAVIQKARQRDRDTMHCLEQQGQSERLP